jgi:hypothetical protein
MNPPCKTWCPGGVLCDDTQCQRMNPPCKTWRPGGVQCDDTQCQRMNPPCKTWRPGGVLCEDTQCHRMNPACKTKRPRKSKTRTRDAIRPHNRKRRAPLPRATIIVTNSAALSRACVFQRRLATGDDFLESVERHYQERRPSAQTRAAGVSPPWVQEPHLQRRRGTVRRIFARAPRAAGVSPPWLGEPHAVRRKPRTIRRPCNGRTRVATVSPPWVGTASAAAFAHTPATIDCYTRAAGVSPSWVQEAHLQLVAKVAGWLLASAARRGLVGGGLPIVYRELTCSCVSGTTAGLRQPLLVHDARSPGNHFLQCGVAQAPRAATVSPPWFGEPHAVRRKPRTIRRPCNGRTTGRPSARLCQVARIFSAMCRTRTRKNGSSPTVGPS